MKITKKQFYYFILLLFVCYGINNYIFERVFFFNEILSLIGFIFLFKQIKFLSRDQDIILKIPPSGIFKAVLCFLLIGFFHLIISLYFKTNWYYYLRGLSTFYSIFSFFLGFYLLTYFFDFIQLIKKYLSTYLFYSLLFPAVWLLERFMGAVFFPFLFKRISLQNIFFIAILDIFLAIRYQSLTVVIVTVLLLILLFIPNYSLFRLLFLSASFTFFVFFISISSNLSLYKVGGYSLYGNILAVAYSNPLLNVDGNSTWRTVLWYRVITEKFPQNLIGIGFGTPLLPYKVGYNTTESGKGDEYDAHTTGCHNTYLTLTIRLGILYLLITLWIYHTIFKDFFRYKRFYQDKPAMIFFISFFTISIIGLFNLVLESPTVASLYWVLLGFVAKVIEERKKASFEITHS